MNDNELDKELTEKFASSVDSVRAAMDKAPSLDELEVQPQPTEIKPMPISMVRTALTGRLLPRRSRLLAVESEPTVAHVRLNNEWYCDDYTRVIAFGVVNAKAWQYNEMFDEIVSIVERKEIENPDEDKSIRERKAFLEWAREKLTHGPAKSN